MKQTSKYFSLLYFLATILGQIAGGLICGIALIPSYLLVTITIQTVPAVQSSIFRIILVCLSIGLGYFLFSNTLLITIVLFKFFFRLRNREGRAEIFSKDTLTNAVYNSLLGIAIHFSLPLVRSTPLINLFYRGMGAKIGKNTLIATSRVWDCDLIEIGSDCIIGGNVAISAHIGQGKRGRLRRVKIGDRVTIGANSMVLPGVVIEDDVLVGPNSLVPMGKKLLAKSVYWGVPVEKYTAKLDN